MSLTVADARSPVGETVTDTDRRHALRRMKTVASSFLVVAAVVFVVALRLQASGVDAAWVGFVRAAAEAAMVGGLADWFAVTALFRHPLGIPIPHTALIPTRKDQLGRGLADFVSANFLGEEVIRDKLRSTDLARRIGEWIGTPDHARRVTDELAAAARGALNVLGDEQVHQLVQESLLPRLATIEVSPPLGRLLQRLVQEDAHRDLVDSLAGQAVTWVAANRTRVMEVVMHQSPTWSPRFVDEAIGGRVHDELLRFVTAVRDDPDHPMRHTIDQALLTLASNLRNDMAVRARVQRAWGDWVTGSGGREAVERVWAPLRASLDQMVAEEDGPLRRRVTGAIEDLGHRLVAEPELRARVDGWIESAALHVVSTYRREIVATISDTVDRWDGDETARRVELYAGRDLQFIRINGTVVGALAGVLIHAVAVLLG